MFRPTLFNTVAILPTGTKLNPTRAAQNEFHAGWRGGTYLLLEADEGGRKIILYGSGAPAL